MQSTATTVEQYLHELDPDRRAIVGAVREVILANLDPAYSEAMDYGMIGYAVPLSLFPAGYNGNAKQALPFTSLASQKNYVSLYLMGLYVGCSDTEETDDMQWFRSAWAASGKKKLDMGKACVRFKKLDDLALDVIGEAIRRMPAQRYLTRYLEVNRKT